MIVEMVSWIVLMAMLLTAHHSMCIRNRDGWHRAAPRNFKRKFRILNESKRSSQFSELKPVQAGASATYTAIGVIEDQKLKNENKEGGEVQHTQPSAHAPCKFAEEVAHLPEPPTKLRVPRLDDVGEALELQSVGLISSHYVLLAF
ncbi:hypothetical protein Aduo_017011 [Ancylostoma duodenale]